MCVGKLEKYISGPNKFSQKSSWSRSPEITSELNNSKLYFLGSPLVRPPTSLALQTMNVSLFEGTSEYEKVLGDKFDLNVTEEDLAAFGE